VLPLVLLEPVSDFGGRVSPVAPQQGVLCHPDGDLPRELGFRPINQGRVDLEVNFLLGLGVTLDVVPTVGVRADDTRLRFRGLTTSSRITTHGDIFRFARLVVVLHHHHLADPRRRLGELLEMLEPQREVVVEDGQLPSRRRGAAA
jgi:hypothetical protein